MDVRNTEKQATTIQSWNILISVLLGLAYQKSSVAFKEGVKDGKEGIIQGQIVDLCQNEHFIESQITNLSIYDENNKEYKITSLNKADLPAKPKRVVIRIDHMDLEYIPADNTDNERILITGQQYNLYSSDEIECYYASREKAKAALNLAYTAKAMGWTQIDFGQTSDPIDRLFLMKACQHVGLDYDGEKLTSSIVPGATIIKPVFTNSVAIMNAKQGVDKRGSKADPALIVVNEGFKAFFQSPESPLPKRDTNQPPPTNSGAAATLGL